MRDTPIPDQPWRSLLLTASYALASLVSVSVARAHVAWPDFHSARCAITLDEQQLRVEVILEIPIHEVVLAFNAHYQDIDLIAAIEAGRIEELETSFKNDQFERLAGGLALSIDGRGVEGPWRPVDSPINGRGSEGFFVYMLEHTTKPPPGRRLTVTLRNENFEGSQVMFANLTTAGGTWQVHRSSVEQPPREADLTIGSEAELALWSPDEERRRFEVTFRAKRSRGR